MAVPSDRRSVGGVFESLRARQEIQVFQRQRTTAFSLRPPLSGPVSLFGTVRQQIAQIP
jgi:hypothetical protein